MSTKVKIILGAAVVLTAFALGRVTVPTKVKIITQTVTVDKKTDDTKAHVKDHKKYTVTETDKPDGTKTKVTTITDDKDTDKEDKSIEQTQIDKTQTKEITRSTQPVTISALGGATLFGTPSIVYGGSISKPVLGPIGIGIFGLSNGIAGLSVGVSF